MAFREKRGQAWTAGKCSTRSDRVREGGERERRRVEQTVSSKDAGSYDSYSDWHFASFVGAGYRAAGTVETRMLLIGKGVMLDSERSKGRCQGPEPKTKEGREKVALWSHSGVVVVRTS